MTDKKHFTPITITFLLKILSNIIDKLLNQKRIKFLHKTNHIIIRNLFYFLTKRKWVVSFKLIICPKYNPEDKPLMSILLM